MTIRIQEGNGIKRWQFLSVGNARQRANMGIHPSQGCLLGHCLTQIDSIHRVIQPALDLNPLSSSPSATRHVHDLF